MEEKLTEIKIHTRMYENTKIINTQKPKKYNNDSL